jgi:UDP-N-acetylmuramyl pentapeptide synthase
VKGWLDEHYNATSVALKGKLDSLKEYTAEQLPKMVDLQEENRREAARLLEESKKFKPSVSTNEKV